MMNSEEVTRLGSKLRSVWESTFLRCSGVLIRSARSALRGEAPVLQLDFRCTIDESIEVKLIIVVTGRVGIASNSVT